jgi:tripartite-type tricarboxylate transporter receptor subunit TctC
MKSLHCHSPRDKVRARNRQAPRTSCFARTIIMAAAAFALASGVASARDFPLHALKIIVPSSPGGGYDYLARVYAEKLPAELGQPIVVENRTGSGTLVGTQVAAAAAPDGHTLLVGGLANLALNIGLFDKPGYDPIAEFTPVGMVGSITYTLVARKDLPQNTVAEVIAEARAHPGKLVMAAAGMGSGQHVGAALFETLARVDMLNVQYKGAQPVYTDLLAGRVDLFVDNTTTARPLVDSGRIKALATTGEVRDRLLPNVPTGLESGIDGLVLESWFGLFVSTRTPPAALETLRRAFARVSADPDLRGRFESSGWRMSTLNPTESARLMRTEIDRWVPLLRKAGIKAE